MDCEQGFAFPYHQNAGILSQKQAMKWINVFRPWVRSCQTINLGLDLAMFCSILSFSSKLLIRIATYYRVYILGEIWAIN